MAVITLVETTRWAARYCLHRVANVANVLIGLVGIGSLLSTSTWICSLEWAKFTPYTIGETAVEVKVSTLLSGGSW